MPTALLRSHLRTQAPAPVKHLRIALAGCGVVGGELVRLISARSSQIEARQQLRLSIEKVLVRDVTKPRSVPIPKSLFTSDVAQFLACDADIIVEAIGGLTPAFVIAGTALSRGKRFITANKALLADCGDGLVALADSTGGHIDFEAAVGGGVPVVRALRHSLRNVPVRSIRGILNGTTNFILTRIELGDSFAEALAAAQANGFAEADPSRDLNGLDAADKLRVLAWTAFGVAPRSINVACEGISAGTEQLVRYARTRGENVRLIATCTRDADGAVHACVRPELVPCDSPFGRAINEQNVIALDVGWSQDITLTGPGAGGLPTATALLGDILCC
jgi:homoserine dehydrogenase